MHHGKQGDFFFWEASPIPHGQRAMASELQSIHNNHTWSLVSLPPGKRSITARWIFKLKQGLNGSLVRYKVCLVAWDFQQKHGIDYQEIFASVVPWKTIKTVAAIASHIRWPIH